MRKLSSRRRWRHEQKLLNPRACYWIQGVFGKRGLGPRNRHSVDAQSGRVDSGLEGKVARKAQMPEHVLEIAGDGDLAHRISELAFFDPEAGGTPAVIAGDAIDAHPHEFGHIKAGLDIGDELAGSDRAGLEPEIGGGGAGRGRGSACGMAGGLKAELACRGEIEEPGGEHPIFDHRAPVIGDALGIEGFGAQGALAVWVIDDIDTGGEQALTKLVLEEARTARDRRTADRADEMPRETVGDTRIINHRYLAGRDFARFQPPDGTLAGSAADRGGVGQIAAMDDTRIIIIALHAEPNAREHRDTHPMAGRDIVSLKAVRGEDRDVAALKTRFRPFRIRDIG